MNHSVIDTSAFILVAMLACVGSATVADFVWACFSGHRLKAKTALRSRYAVYCGVQPGFGAHETFTFWTLRDHRLGMKHSTIDERWLDDAIRAYERGEQAPEAPRLSSAFVRSERAMASARPSPSSVATLAGHRWVAGRHCQVHVVVTCDPRAFLTDDRAGPDAPTP